MGIFDNLITIGPDTSKINSETKCHTNKKHTYQHNCSCYVCDYKREMVRCACKQCCRNRVNNTIHRLKSQRVYTNKWNQGIDSI